MLNKAPVECQLFVLSLNLCLYFGHFSFRQTDENLYRGVPSNKTASKNSNLFADSRKDNSLFSPTKRSSLFADNDDLDFGGYQPSSLGSSTKPLGSRVKLQAEDTNTWKVKGIDGGGQKKTNVINDLFGNQPNTQPSIFDDDDPFSSRKPQSPSKILPLRPRANHSTTHNQLTEIERPISECMLLVSGNANSFPIEITA